MIDIRHATPDDSEALYAISLATGDGGQDAAPNHRHGRLIGDIYSVPYVHLEPALSFVAVDAQGVAGFAVGTADTRAFEARLAREWLPDAARRYPPADAPDLTLEDRRFIDALFTPWANPDAVVADCPAHMHLNLLARARGKGVGRSLFLAVSSALRDAGAGGVHIGAFAKNTDGIAFWSAMGFRRLPASTDDTIWMGRSLERE